MPGFESEEDEDLLPLPPSVDTPSASYNSCPECGTTRLMDPNLRLRFSSCCGRCMCAPCIDERFKTVKHWWTCTICQEKLLRENFKAAPLEQQRYETAVQRRLKGNKENILNLDASDFPAFPTPDGQFRSFDDYLEWTAEQVFQLSYGGATAREAAEAAMANFAQRNQEAIKRARARKRSEAVAQEKRDLMAQMGIDPASAAAAAAAQQQQQQQGMGLSFALPQPLDANSSGGGSVWQAEESRVLSLSDPKVHASERAQLQEKRRQAGGFRREDDLERCRSDALGGLFI